MRAAWKLALAFLCRDKKQTLALFTGIFLAAGLLCGVGSLFSSGLEASKENARVEYGDWHYNTRCDQPWFDDFLADPTGDGFTLESYGVETVRKAIEEPFAIQYVSADDGYLNLMGRDLITGRMPEATYEIALDVQTLRNLGMEERLGEQVVLDGETFTLTGIVADMPEKLSDQMGDFMQVFVSSNLDYGMNGSFVYLKFDESRPVIDQIAAFSEKYGIDGSRIARNNGLAAYVGGDVEQVTPGEIVGALMEPTYGLPYVWSILNENQAMTEGAMLLALALFAGFIIYSLFQVSVLRRQQQYSVLQTLGLTNGGIFRVLYCELLAIFVVAYGAGAALGNAVAALIYGRIGRIFAVRDTTALHSGVDTSVNAEVLSVANLPDVGVFHVDWSLAAGGALFLAAILAVISFALVRRMRRLSLRQMLVGDGGSRRRSRKIMSLRHGSLTGVLTKRFMFARKSTFIGILLSLSIGGVIFLGATYVIDNTRINNELTFAADDGLGSDIQLSEETGSLAETIPDEAVASLRTLDGVESVLPVSYQLGEVELPDGTFQMPAYYPETAGEEGFEQDPLIMERYNGIIVQTGDDDYRLKVNIYGYDDAMLSQLNDYLLDGEIDPDAMRAENSVIIKTLVDGQGNYDGIDFATGDALAVKTPRDAEAEGEVLRFLSNDSQYQTTDVTIAALVSRPLGKVETTIGDDGETTVDIIMTQEQMQAYFGVSGYQTVSLSLEEGADAALVAAAVRDATMGIPGCVVHDYTGQIAAQELYLRQQMLFFYGIAAVLLVTSLLHIVNSMHYLVAERRREFAILRAMGITDAGFLRMLAKEGARYGVYASVVMLILYWLTQKVLYYFLQHVYLYLHPAATIATGYLLAMVAVNLGLCAGAMFLSGRRALKATYVA